MKEIMMRAIATPIHHSRTDLTVAITAFLVN